MRRLTDLAHALGWIRFKVTPDGAAAAIAAQRLPVCYVLPEESRADLSVLIAASGRLGMPRPTRRLLIGGKRAPSACFVLERNAGWFGHRSDRRPPVYLARLMAAIAADPDFDVALVPVSVFWGRAAPKEGSWWRELFTENRALVGRFRRLLTVLFNGRNTLLYCGAPLSLRELAFTAEGAPRGVRQVARSLRAAIHAQRSLTLGPDLPQRRHIIAQVLRTLAVRRAVRHEMRTRGGARRANLILAKRCAEEIAADYSPAFASTMSVLLGWFWNRLYDGIRVAHFDEVHQLSGGAAIVYVPCHRSHMDYLLLSYAIYQQGFALPHVAAGVNLNLPVIGRILRMGGGFFIRRSFKGDALYAVVFANYLGVLMARGHPLEFFIEGGRSRTGRLLAPKVGMLSMTVRSHLRDPKRPVVFLPVYFGYERIVEGRTYLGELSGRPKQKESILGVLKTLPALRRRFGSVHVNLGAPIYLDALLSQHCPGWRAAAVEADSVRADWVGATVEDLARRITTGINAAAAVNPVNLVAMALLASPRLAMPEAELVGQLDLYQALLREQPYGPLVTLTPDDGAAMVRHAERMRLLERRAHPLGDILWMTADNAVLATYYRNNVLHLFAMPSLLACCFISNETMTGADIQRLIWRVYPYIAAELFLRWDESEVAALTDALLSTFVRLGLLTVDDAPGVWRRPVATSPAARRLSLLAATTIQTIERYYLAIAVLNQAGSGRISRDDLEQRCHLLAQRMSLLFGLNSPEFFDKSLFRSFIDLMLRRGVLVASADGRLEYGELLVGVAADARFVLSEQIRSSILQVTLV